MNARPRRRLVFFAIAALVLGAATDYLVAINSRSAACATITTVGGIGQRGDAWTARIWLGTRRDAGNISFARKGTSNALSPGEAAASIPHAPWRAAYTRTLADERIQTAFINLQAYGWPMRSWAGYFINSRETGLISGWIQVSIGQRQESLPYLPLLGGALANAAFFGSVWFVILLAVGRVFRRRHRSGMCPQCGYDLRGLRGDRCPECGADATAVGGAR